MHLIILRKLLNLGGSLGEKSSSEDHKVRSCTSEVTQRPATEGTGQLRGYWTALDTSPDKWSPRLIDLFQLLV